MAAPQTLPANFNGWDKPPATLPANFAQWDQSTNSAPAAQPGVSNTPPKTFWDRVQENLPGSADTGLKGAVNHIQDTLGFLKSSYDVSAPGIAQQIYKKLSGQPNELKALPGKMVTAFALSGQPEGEVGAPEEQPAEAAQPAAAANAQQAGANSGPLSRALEVAKRRISDNSIVRGAKDINYVLRGAGEEAAPPAPPAPTVPLNWGQGRYGTPVDQWGQILPTDGEAPAAPEEPATPLPKVKAKTIRQSQSLGPNAQVLNEAQSLNAPRSIVTDPQTGAPEFSDVVAAKQAQAAPAAETKAPPAATKPAQTETAAAPGPSGDALLDRLKGVADRIQKQEAAAPGSADEDLVQQAQDSLDIVRARKATASTASKPAAETLDQFNQRLGAIADRKAAQAASNAQQTASSGDLGSVFQRLVKGEAGQAGLPGSVTDADEGISDIQNRPVMGTKTGQVPASGFLKMVGADRNSVLKTPRDLDSVFYHAQQIAKNGPPDVELHVDEGGNVIGAQGRHRAIAAVEQGGPNAKVNVTIYKHPFENSP